MKRVINENEANHRKYISDLKRKSKHTLSSKYPLSKAIIISCFLKRSSSSFKARFKSSKFQSLRTESSRSESPRQFRQPLVGSCRPFRCFIRLFVLITIFVSTGRLRRRRIAGSFLSSSICQQERGETPKLRAGPGTGSQQGPGGTETARPRAECA